MGRVTKIDIKVKNDEQKGILISVLSDMKFYAFEETPDMLSAFIKEEDIDEDKMNEVVSGYGCEYTKSVIEETNWNAKWESEFSPVVVDDFVAVRANFHELIPNVKHEIIITPKMSFGTGHHATTYLMLQQMKNIDFNGKNVFDFGTGTGVLAVLADKLGGRVMAIDNDDWSITNAKENFEVNDCGEIELQKADAPPEGKKYDVILANINLNIILANIERMIKSMDNKGIIIVSGVLTKDVEVVSKCFNLQGYIIVQKAEREGWACLTYKLQ
jgi:ribosomal protein L11 methyltransferase